MLIQKSGAKGRGTGAKNSSSSGATSTVVGAKSVVMAPAVEEEDTVRKVIKYCGKCEACRRETDCGECNICMVRKMHY